MDKEQDPHVSKESELDKVIKELQEEEKLDSSDDYKSKGVDQTPAKEERAANEDEIESHITEKEYEKLDSKAKEKYGL